MSRLGLVRVATLWNMIERGYKVAQRDFSICVNMEQRGWNMAQQELECWKYLWYVNVHTLFIRNINMQFSVMQLLEFYSPFSYVLF